MNIDTWNKSGIDWMRKSKSAGFNGFIITDNFPLEADLKAKELGFKLVPIVAEFGDKRDQYKTVAKQIKKGDRCLFVDFDVIPKNNLSETKDLVCSTDDSLDLFEVIFSIRNLQDRAKAVELIQEKIIKTHKFMLSAKSILGTWDFWNGFSGFQNYLKDKTYLDPRGSYDDLMLNIYVSLKDSVSIEVHHD
jgi:hypothetical protein